MKTCLGLPVALILYTTACACDAEPEGLKATLSAGPKGSIVVVFRNGTGRDVKIDKQVIASAILTLEVRDATGRVLPTIPPAVPAAKQEFLVIASGKELTRSYELNIFMPPLAEGVYRVRVPWKDWLSNDLRYRVGE